MSLDLSSIARRLNGKISGAEVRAPAPGCAPDDDSLVVQLDPDAPYRLRVHSTSGEDPAGWREYVLGRLGPEFGAQDHVQIEVVSNGPGQLEYHQPSADAAPRRHSAERPSIEQALNRDGDALQKRSAKPTDELIAIATTECDLFHAPDGMTYADTREHGAALSIESREFEEYLTRRYWNRTGNVPNPRAMSSALRVIKAKARFDGPPEDVHLRVAGLNGTIYVDLGDENGRAVEITPEGWRVIDRPPVHFRRGPGMRPLPMPQRGGSIDLLRPFLNVSDDGFVLAISWLVGSFRPGCPYPVLILTGQQGSSKSTGLRLLRSLNDPNVAPLRSLPQSVRNLLIASESSHVLCFDNVSCVSPWLSDELCRIASGGGASERQLRTDRGEVLFEQQRPIALNGIVDFISRSDLADRALFVEMLPISEERRRDEATMMAEFEKVRPLILGALFDAVAHGLNMLPNVTVDRLPRMADFAKWIIACEGALWPAGTFIRVYRRNIAAAAETVVEADPIADAVRRFMEKRARWEGSATELLAELARVTPEATRRVRSAHGWPSIPNQLSARMARAEPALRRLGIGFKRTVRGHWNERVITLSRLPQDADGSRASVADEGNSENSTDSQGLRANDDATSAPETPAPSSASGHAPAASGGGVPLDSARDRIVREPS